MYVKPRQGHAIEPLGLGLNETKTQVVDAGQASFKLLAFAIQMSQGARIGKAYSIVRPANKSLKKIQARLTPLRGRNLTPIALETIVGNVNLSLRGWVYYFHYRNSSLAMDKVRNYAQDRL